MSMLTNYRAITYEDGAVKTIEEFGLGTDGNSMFVQYFMNPSENKSDVIASYSGGNTGLEVYFNSQSQNGFTQWNWEKYAPDGTLKLKGFIVFNSKNWEVMVLPLNPNTGTMFLIGYKCYYGNVFPNQYDDLLLKFDYNAEGSLKSVSDFNDTYGFNQGELSADEFIAYMQSIQQDFSWDQHPYFQSLTPYLPNSTDL